MEREIVSNNLMAIKEAVMNRQEILVDLHHQDMLTVCSKESWENLKDQQRKDRTKFVISKTIAYCPSVFEQDVEIRDLLFSISDKLIAYFQMRQMGPLAELMKELISNEKAKDALFHDYEQKKLGDH